ncbi:ras association domain-containing protein 7-like [Echeneis naucrates]|uniref:ras association domain-containing protein 7-like n=1 Tax=Echeneis naucrates TaxID=173247 RepID=UPI0011138ED9|nr:ras association domain-containing protein 7-like [Echeneis naucrates]XP_029354001.1 ras association domain-containing protein 7-like [Echeneis naucrates]
MMELKVWVEGVVRVVCGVSLDTSCQDVVIALAQAIGQTGRYILILKLRGNETHLVAEDCPLQHLAQLGQLALEVQFILRRTGPSLSEGQNTSVRERFPPLAQPSEPEPFKYKGPQKALTFNLGPSTLPKRIKPNRDWSPSPRHSPETRESPVPFLDTANTVTVVSTDPFKEEVFRQILQQQRILQNLEVQLQALERETEVWEDVMSSAPVPGLPLDLAEELEELEQHLRQNKAELMNRVRWEEQLQEELDREQDMYRRLHQIQSSVDDQIADIMALQAHSGHLEQDLELAVHRHSMAVTQQHKEALEPLRHELDKRLQQGEELGATVSETQRRLQTAKEILQERWELIEDLNTELRHCNLQQFIQRTSSPNPDQLTSLPVNEVYLSNAGIME